MSKAYYENSSKSRSDLYSYTGRVKFFDREKECGSILEIEDAGRSERVVGEWRVTAQHLGNVVLNSGDYVYFMKKQGVWQILRLCTCGIFCANRVTSVAEEIMFQEEIFSAVIVATGFRQWTEQPELGL